MFWIAILFLVVGFIFTVAGSAEDNVNMIMLAIICLVLCAVLFYYDGARDYTGTAATGPGNIPNGTYTCLAQGDDLLGRKILIIKMDGEEPKTLLVKNLPDGKIVSVLIGASSASVYCLEGNKTVGPKPIY